jgi:hypothetical protein
MPAQASFSVVRGQDLSFPLYLSPRQDVSNWLVEFRAVGLVSLATIVKTSADGGVAVVDAANGVFMVNLLGADTANLFPDTFLWCFRRTDQGKNTPYASGSCFLLPSP